ncbi:LPS export ABC transporter periplasmic protein LptC [Shimia abyssi]|uniref:Lipopolysaccharide export system protein LptC n=1 Tax=Shimia abyssi TaxID=1662395 RepID=A0A2P8F8J0_9RHOB|nr:LPS export ABC transporter periplasmic protein LptC [Shimia abyssi]PSL18033.1 lipopolysaccharide export system protein LptC [Shimia abyssi]
MALPLAALALLSTLFLVPRNIDTDASIPFAEVELEQRLRTQQITAPYFSGQTEQGHMVAVTSETARPDPDDPKTTIAENVFARIDTTAGQTYTATSDIGLADSQYQEVTLEGDVVMTTSSSYTITTEEMIISLREIRAESGAEIFAEGPLGTLNAGRMALRPADTTDDIYLFFTNGVKLIYNPKDFER